MRSRSKKYFILVCQENWRCGDGCCSDHWIEAYLYQNKKEIGRIEDIRHFGYKDDSEEEVKEYILDYFELKEEEVEWDY